eukprot:scpid70414/ scgid23742/ Oxysterol-binding protein 1
MPDGKVAPEYRGWLSKWTNYLKGYQKRWFVLNNGLLSYYRTQEEMAHTCRGTINLAAALIDTVDTMNFVISNGGAQQFYLRAPSALERQRWVTALELAKAKAIKQLDLEHSASGVGWSDPSSPVLDSQSSLRDLSSKLEELTACSTLLYRRGVDLQRDVSDISPDLQAAQRNSPGGSGAAAGRNGGNGDVALATAFAQLKSAHEKATLVKVSTTALMSACENFMSAAQTHQETVTEELNSEREKRQRLEETVETIAKQHNALERAVKKRVSRPSSSATRDEIDAIAAGASVVSSGDSCADGSAFLSGSEDSQQPSELEQQQQHRRNDSAASGKSSMMSDYDGRASSDEDGDDQFFDAEESLASRSPVPGAHAKVPFGRPGSANSSTSATSGEITAAAVVDERRASMQPPVGWPRLPATDAKKSRQYRTLIADKPNHRMSLWGIMKNCIGRDLSKIPMPVNFNEPLSFLQRLCEVELEYSDILTKAAACEDACEQLALVAAFTVSTYSSTAYR